MTTAIPRTIRSSSQPNPSIPQEKTCCDKIWDVVKKTFLVLAAMVLFIANPTIFVVAFLSGIMWSNKVKKSINRIEAVWNRQPWIAGLVIVAASVLALPVTLAATSAILALHLGSRC